MKAETLLAKDGCTKRASFEIWTKPRGGSDAATILDRDTLTVKCICRAHTNDRVVWLTMYKKVADAMHFETYHIAMEFNVSIQTPYPVILHERGMTPEKSRVEATH